MNDWVAHIKSVHKKNANLSYKEAMVLAAKTYKKVKR